MKKFLLVLSVTLFLSITPINIAFARGGSDDNSSTGTLVASDDVKTEIENNRKQIKENMLTRQKEEKARIASRAAERKERLEESKLRICENRKTNIVNRANKIASSSAKHFSRFGEIVAKTDKFYTEKLVPKGVVVTNYTTLKADIATQQAIVAAAIATMKAKIAAFDCSSLDPKGHLEDFKAQAKIVHEDMKDYRTAIQNFIKAIKASVEEKKSATISAEPELD